jgi:glycosyltransferase involved in cell wall biosynthesis
MIVQVGPYPEPLGGVSVYIKRMKDYLDILGIPNQVWDLDAAAKPIPNVIATSMKSLPLRYLLSHKVELIHYHLYSRRSKIIVGYLNRFFHKERRKLLTIHGEAKNMFVGDDDRGLINALNSFNALICVRKGDRSYLEGQGINTAIYEIPAYIAPRLCETAEAYPAYVTTFLRTHSFILAANASALRFHDETDLYGLDLCIDLMRQLKKRYPERRIGFVFGLSEVREEEYFRKQRDKIRRFGLEGDFLFMIEKCEFYPVIRNCHIFIRPTNTDGYSVSLAEGIFFKVPVIASDVVERPAGTILFKTRDGLELFHKTCNIMENYNHYKELAAKIHLTNNAETITRLYREMAPKIS